jgi:hypothetical protein
MLQAEPETVQLSVPLHQVAVRLKHLRRYRHIFSRQH